MLSKQPQLTPDLVKVMTSSIIISKILIQHTIWQCTFSYDKSHFRDFNSQKQILKRTLGIANARQFWYLHAENIWSHRCKVYLSSYVEGLLEPHTVVPLWDYIEVVLKKKRGRATAGIWTPHIACRQSTIVSSQFCISTSAFPASPN